MKQSDICTIDHIKTLVDSFYAKVRKDNLLAAIFNNVIQDRWPTHLETMYRFWGTILLGHQGYHGSPFTPHASLNLTKEHFTQWIRLFHETIDEHFFGEKANEAKWRAERMAEMFLYKIEYYHNNPSKPLS